MSWRDPGHPVGKPYITVTNKATKVDLAEAMTNRAGADIVTSAMDRLRAEATPVDTLLDVSDATPALKEPPPIGGETEATVLAKLLAAVSVAADRFTQLTTGVATAMDVRDTVEAYTVFKAAAQE